MVHLHFSHSSIPDPGFLFFPQYNLVDDFQGPLDFQGHGSWSVRNMSPLVP